MLPVIVADQGPIRLRADGMGDVLDANGNPTGETVPLSDEHVAVAAEITRTLTRDELQAKVDALSTELAAVKTELKSGVATMNAIIAMPRANFTTIPQALSTVNYVGDRMRELATVLKRTMEVVYAGQVRTVAGFRIMVDQLDDPVDDDDVNAARAKAADQPVTRTDGHP